MGLFDKFEAVRAARSILVAAGADPAGVRIDKILSATEAIISGRKTILAGSNNYLGLTFDPSCIEAGRRALGEAGTGTTGSRMANGTYASHLALESELADFFGYPFALVFSTGYSASLGCITALTGSGDAVLLDADAHASLYDGGRMSEASVYRFKHNNVSDLEKRLRRMGDRAGNALIVVEGVYSILGDRAPLAEIVRVKNTFGARLMVDEAHSLGIYGALGRGVVEEAGVADGVDFIVGTFSKSLAAIGGFCVSPHEELNLLRYASRPYIFTASPCPSVIATTRQALRELRSRPQLRKDLWHNAHNLYEALGALGFSLGPDVSPIVAVRFGAREQALGFWKGLLDRGIYTNLILPPATPDGGSLVRCSVTAAHTQRQIDSIIEAFSSLSGSDRAPAGVV